MRGRVAEVTEQATSEYVAMVNARDAQLAQLNLERGALHDAAMASLPFWLVRYDLMRQFAWNHGHTHAGGWRQRWKVRVARIGPTCGGLVDTHARTVCLCGYELAPGVSRCSLRRSDSLL